MLHHLSIPCVAKSWDLYRASKSGGYGQRHFVGDFPQHDSETYAFCEISPMSIARAIEHHEQTLELTRFRKSNLEKPASNEANAEKGYAKRIKQV